MTTTAVAAPCKADKNGDRRGLGVVMVIDDSVESLAVMELLLTNAGYLVCPFPESSLALAAAHQSPPDLILLDIRMPGKSGYDVCCEIRTQGLLRDTPIIFLSALSGARDIAHGFACGAQDFITKPFREPEVLARVQTHIALHKAHTELADNYERLQQMEDLRDNLVHMMVHDMRSPLQTMVAQLEFIRADVQSMIPNEEGRAFDTRLNSRLNDIEAAANNISRMVSSVLDLSRLEARHLPVQAETVPVQDVVTRGGSDFVRCGVMERLQLSVPEGLADLWCDRELTGRVLANLIDNALKYSPLDTPVTVGATSVVGGLRLWVRDSGPGIPREDWDRVFDRFACARTSPVCVHGANASANDTPTLP
ncbi:MAG: response regulator, partial [Lentisphaerae bacterium]|nr:response regulator [Lentisphaerota bacterium]